MINLSTSLLDTKPAPRTRRDPRRATMYARRSAWLATIERFGSRAFGDYTADERRIAAHRYQCYLDAVMDVALARQAEARRRRVLAFPAAVVSRLVGGRRGGVGHAREAS